MVKETKSNTKLSEGFKRKWVDALRSGNYKQGYNLMFDPKNMSYDPIGVAYRVCGVPDKEISNKEFPTGKQYRFVPKQLVKNNDFVKKIIDFSDRGLSFKWIASYIERYL